MSLQFWFWIFGITFFVCLIRDISYWLGAKTYEAIQHRLFLRKCYLAGLATREELDNETPPGFTLQTNEVWFCGALGWQPMADGNRRCLLCGGDDDTKRCTFEGRINQ